MAQGHSSRHSVRYVAESTFGTTPTTPTFIDIPNTGSTLKVAKNTFVSQTVRNDRQINDMRHGVRRAEGNINFELAYGDFDTFLEAALMGSWSTNVLKTGTTLAPFSIERAFADISEFWNFKGCLINTLSLNIQPDAMVTGSFGIIGSGLMTPASSTAANSVTAASAYDPFDAFSGSITEGGASANITALSMELNNGLVGSYIVGSETAPQVNYGQSNLTGSLTAWFESETLLNKFLAETESEVVLTLAGITGGDLAIDIPRIKFTDGAVDVQNANDGLLAVMPWQALYSSGDASNIVITRTPA